MYCNSPFLSNKAATISLQRNGGAVYVIHFSSVQEVEMWSQWLIKQVDEELWKRTQGWIYNLFKMPTSVSSTTLHRGRYRATEGGWNFTSLCTMCMRKWLTKPTFDISRWMTTMPRQKILLLSSEIIEIIAKSPDILCIIWTKGI